MALNASFDHQVLVEENSCVRTLILNRPDKLNSLTYQMMSRLLQKLRDYEKNSSIKCVILKGNGKAFSAGGDAAAISQTAIAGDWSFAARLYRRQLILDYLISTYEKPLVSLVNGITMGGGAGLCMNGRFCVVTEKAVFAMPETLLGLYPDVGASYFLSRLPGFFGEYVGLTAARLDGAEMVICGLATHFVISSNLSLLEEALSGMSINNNNSISEIINGFTVIPNLKKESAYNSLSTINKCFAKDTVEEILFALEHEAVDLDQKWLHIAIKNMKAASPTSLKIFLRSIREGRMQNIDQCLIREYRMSSHFLRRTVSGDFYEGTRAILVDKDKHPKWEPSKLEQVTDEMVQQYFTKVDDEDWKELQLPRRSTSNKLGLARL